MDAISAVGRAELAVAQLRAGAIYSRYSQTIVKPTSEEIASDVRRMEQIVDRLHQKYFARNHGYTINFVG